ncbi:MAG: hypothetical protein AB9869_00165 [Verrucomicrobiia bacterium]
MNKSLLMIALAASLQLTSAQEQLPREEALKLAFFASLNLEQLQGTPIPTDVDLKRPIALRDGDYGGLFLPEAKLNAEAIAKAGEKIVPVGQLWLHMLTPVHQGQPVDSSSLRMVNVSLPDGAARVAQCTLGVRKTSSGGLQMVVLGKSTEPVATASLRPVEGRSSDGIKLTADRDDSGGTGTLVLFGKYQAQLRFTELVD